MKTKKEVIQYLMEEVEKMIPLKIISKRKKFDEVTFTVDNNCKIEFYFNTVLGARKVKIHLLYLYLWQHTILFLKVIYN